MDIYDPNTWDARFVKRNTAECVQSLKETNMLVNKYVKEGNYTAAVAGIDRILNGLFVFYNARIVDCSKEICMFSWAEANIIGFGIDAPQYKRRTTMIPLLKDARDFTTSDNNRELLSDFVDVLEDDADLNELKQYMEPDFPSTTLDWLEKLNSRW